MGGMVVQPIVTSNWAGAIIPAAAGKNFSSISAQWVVPAMTQVPISGIGQSQASMWVGLDGTSSSADVCQAGVLASVTTNANGLPAVSYQAWGEWYPGASVPVPSGDFTVDPGDTIKVTVATLGEGSTQAVFVYDNETTNQLFAMRLNAPAGVSLKGDTAEAVVETPTYHYGDSGYMPLLSDFQATPVSFQNTIAQYSDGSLVGPSSAIPFEMADYGAYEAFGTVQPGSNTVNVFENTYWA
jgi:hypothetical protein